MMEEAGQKPVLEIDGARFDDLAGFFDDQVNKTRCR
jgi:hypothetical protein